MENLLSSVQAARARYGATLTDDECAALCNAVAWQHRATGWGLSRKTSGTRGRLPNGTEVAHDILHYQPTNTLVDVLTAAGAASTPTWNPVGPPQSADRTWVAPVDPATWAPAPIPTPAPTPAPSLDLQPVRADLAVVQGQLAALGQELAALRSELGDAKAVADRMAQQLAAGVPLRLRAGFLGTLTGTVGGS